MKVIDLERWADFQSVLDDVSGHVRNFRDGVQDEIRRVLKDKDLTGREDDPLAIPAPSKTLFRGQPDARWSLQTTLERISGKEHNSIHGYLEKILGLQPQIETYTRQSWRMPDSVAVSVLQELVNRHTAAPLVIYEYMAYLRHHGFPSPLLDWTSSPYVAAYFAFERLPEPGVEQVTVYAYIEDVGAGKVGS